MKTHFLRIAAGLFALGLLTCVSFYLLHARPEYRTPALTYPFAPHHYFPGGENLFFIEFPEKKSVAGLRRLASMTIDLRSFLPRKPNQDDKQPLVQAGDDVVGIPWTIKDETDWDDMIRTNSPSDLANGPIKNVEFAVRLPDDPNLFSRPVRLSIRGTLVYPVAVPPSKNDARGFVDERYEFTREFPFTMASREEKEQFVRDEIEYKKIAKENGEKYLDEVSRWEATRSRYLQAGGAILAVALAAAAWGLVVPSKRAEHK